MLEKNKDMECIKLLSAKKNNALKVIISGCALIVFSINGFSQTRINIDLSYDKTGQLVLEEMTDYYSTLFTYDKAGNRIRKLTDNQIFGEKELNSNPNTTITVFPVPASNEISVSFNIIKDDYVTFSIISIEGKKYYTERKYMHAGENIHKIDVSNLSNGSYILDLTNNKEKYSSIIIVK